MKQKPLREDAHCAREEDVADATALGARISRARFFVLRWKRFLWKKTIKCVIVYNKVYCMLVTYA